MKDFIKGVGRTIVSPVVWLYNKSLEARENGGGAFFIILFVLTIGIMVLVASAR